MRIWSLHPRYLDRQGLVACWRESLLAQAVLAGRTVGYTRHPQLERFRSAADPVAAIGAYLTAVADEAAGRGYRFDRSRVDTADVRLGEHLTVTTGQLRIEWLHLRGKLAVRDPDRLALWDGVRDPEPHPLFRVEAGPAASWERAGA
ncbi:pyrimidine dimer DNA glycosylase/endonuclease V [Microbacterium sp. XT11]|uniref:pyrimidine dimer DNA glycosylase/endonuclease V n=1 Tax=Microbacterium sp. XT11 TaxID=367477 RepID=UPI000742D4EE|nr:pyrimidine dimer DNA glycosylase/endonuclease V [Microbacterium sp. XT11]ALX66889.1 pyrimidine dimer DNA glycosylase /DNA-(apurinic or apyrimidinic site) lyase [Microbacterium sp. XT11]